MLCAISLIFIFTVVGAYEINTITTTQAIWFFIYGLIMFYHTSKPYWSQMDVKRECEEKKGNKKNGRR